MTIFVRAWRSLTRPGPGSPWMRGITLSGLGLIFAICVVNTIGNPDFRDQAPLAAAKGMLRNAATFFLAALPMYVLVVRAEMATVHFTPRRRIAVLALAVVVGAILFALVRLGLRFGQVPIIGTAAGYWQNPVGHFFRSLVVGGLLTSMLYFVARERATQRLLQQTRLARVAIDKQMAEARLQLLQAQIEPHFLFNSLASVKRLYEREPGKGRGLLGNLRDYLRTAASGARERETCLSQEIALATSFLAIFQVRMGNRLRVHVDVPAEIASARIPPLMVGTLVENAIKHGIGPRASGGVVGLAARRNGDVLEVDVGDDGVGFRARSGQGIGLANIRARLQTLFGSAGTLDLAANPAGGVTATIRVPFRLAAEGLRL